MKLYRNLICSLIFFSFNLSLKAHPSLIIALKDKPGQLLFLDAETFVERKRLVMDSYPHEVATHEVGHYAVVTHYGNPPLGEDGNKISVIDLRNGRVSHVIELPEGSKPHGVVFINSEEALVTVENSKKLTLNKKTPEDTWVPLPVTSSYVLRVNAKTGEQDLIMSLSGKAPHMIVKHPEEDSFFITDNKTGYVTKISLLEKTRRWSCQGTFHAGESAEGMAISEDGKKLYVANRFNKIIYVLNTSRFTLDSTIKTKGGAIRLALYGQEEQSLITSSLFNHLGARLNTYDLSSKEHIHAMESVGGFWPKWNPIPLPITLLVYPKKFTPGFEQRTLETKKEKKKGKLKAEKLAHRANRVLVANSWAGQVAFVNIDTRQIEQTIKTGGHPDGMAFSSFCPGKERNEDNEALHKALHDLEVEFQSRTSGDHIYDSDNFRVDRTMAAYAVINKPIKKVWEVLTNFNDYSWNKFLTDVKIKEKYGDQYISFGAYLEPGKSPVRRTFKITEVSNHDKKICWGGEAFLGKSVVAKRCLHLVVLDNGKTLYYTRDHFKNCFSGIAYKAMHEKVQKGLELEAKSLKDYCENRKL